MKRSEPSTSKEKNKSVTRKIPGINKEINPIGLGCLQLTEFPAKANDPKRLEAIDFIVKAFEKGINLFDTADFYGTPFGENERILGQAIKKLQAQYPDFREKCLITTKGGIKGITESEVVRDNSPKYLYHACLSSLERLGLEYIDIYYLHRHDDKTSIPDIIDTLAKLVEKGKIKNIGFSETSPDFLLEAIQYAKEKHGLSIAAVQPEYSLASRDIELSGIWDICKRFKIAVISYGSIARGLLTTAIDQDFKAHDFRGFLPRFQPENIANNVKHRKYLDTLAKQCGCTSAQLALYWLLSRSKHIIPIPATTSLEHLQENISAVNLAIPETVLEELSQHYQIDTYDPRYPKIAMFPEIKTDEIWRQRYEPIKRESRKNVTMNDIREVVYTVVKNPSNYQIQEQLHSLLIANIDQTIPMSIDQRMINNLHNGLLTGSLTVLNSTTGKLAVAVAGKMTIKKESRLATPTTTYNLSSISKFIIMNMILKLAHLNLINLDTCISTYLQKDIGIPNSKEITIKQLLSHYSGLQDNGFITYHRDEPLSNILSKQVKHEPGKTFFYCNSNYVILALIIEAVTNTSLEEQFNQLIRIPLRLQHTHLISDKKYTPEYVHGYRYTGTFDIVQPEDNFYIWAAAGFRSTPTDMCYLFQHFFENNTYMPPHLREMAIQSIHEVQFSVRIKKQLHEWPAQFGYGIEKHTVVCGDREVIGYGCGGWQNGSAAFVLYIPSLKLTSCFSSTFIRNAEKTLHLQLLPSNSLFNINMQSSQEIKQPIRALTT